VARRPLVKILSATQLQSMLARGDELLLIDVLPPVSFSKGHLPGAVNVSFYEDGFLERIDALACDRDATVVVACVSASCNASAKAAELLAGAGYANVFDFEGGLREWEEAGFPMEGGSARR
jgi:rhodanese-related sulfurtransferase